MSLLIIILSPIVAGIISWAIGRRSRVAARVVMLLGLLLDVAIIASIWFGSAGSPAKIIAALSAPGLSGGAPAYFLQLHLSWIPSLGIGFDLGMDGLALVMLVLAVLLSLAAFFISWFEKTERDGFFLFNFGLIVAGVFGVFLAVDLLLFFFFWELMLVPMYFIIAIWGSEKRKVAALRFFIFTQASGLLMLLSILAVYFVHGSTSGVYTFNLVALARSGGLPTLAPVIMLGFLIAFAVKLPVVPFHSWLPDAHTEAPTAGSVILAGLLLKTGAYGMLRFLPTMFPVAFKNFAPVAMIFALISIYYGAVLAYRQHDFKRFVAYTSISHMGFVFLGIFAYNTIGYQGAIVLMLAHGFTTSGLFIMAGIIKERLHTREMGAMGGMLSVVPRIAGYGMTFWIFALGFPGTGNFLGEFLVLTGTFHVSVAVTAIATAALVLSVVYSLFAIQKAYHGKQTVPDGMHDLRFGETVLVLVLAALVLWVGLFPGKVFKTMTPMITQSVQYVSGGENQ